MIRRREFIVGLGSAAAWSAVVQAQQPAMPVIGYLGAQSAEDERKWGTIPFFQGLKETGYVEGQNVAVEYRWAEGQADLLPALAADLVRRRVAVIVAPGQPVSSIVTPSRAKLFHEEPEAGKLHIRDCEG
jgi:putative ABC transport system substrate-binding protein